VLARPEDAIGRVNGVVIATDDGAGHTRRARPFVEVGLPVLVDKPLATSSGDLRIFTQWKNAGARLLSFSDVRYALEFDALFAGAGGLGKLRWISGTCL
jgi:predicted dehydrogenase